MNVDLVEQVVRKNKEIPSKWECISIISPPTCTTQVFLSACRDIHSNKLTE